MRAFAHLIGRLNQAASPETRLTLTRDYLRATPDPDRGWALAILTGAVKFKAARTSDLRAAAQARLDAQLFAWSRDYVGDLAETIALVWPSRPGANRPPALADVAEALGGARPGEVQGLIETWLDALDAEGRWLLIRLAAGALKSPIPARLARQAAADLGGADLAEVEAVWHGLTPPYGGLFAWLEGRAPAPLTASAGGLRPMMLAGALSGREALAGLDPAAFAAEWLWEGVRAQAVSEGGVRRLYSRAGEDISAAYPEVIAALTFEGVADGMLPPRDGPRPARLRVHDLLAVAGADLRALPLAERRAQLEALAGGHGGPALELSTPVAFTGWDDLARLRAAPPAGARGLILKRRDSPYLAGRADGAWLKWRREPRRLRALLMYVQAGRGRAGPPGELSFGVWRGDPAGGRVLVLAGKAPCDLAAEDLARLEAFVRDHTTERFGPVRAVRADAAMGLVLEAAFDDLRRSSRHKSGLAMAGARVERLLWDLSPAEADSLAHLDSLLEGALQPL